MLADIRQPNMEAAIRFNQNSLPGVEQLFLKVDVAGRSFHLNRIQEVKKGKVRYDVTDSATKIPSFRAFDWHPTIPTLVAFGQPSGDAGFADLARNEITLTLPAKNQRPCNAVALNTTNILAVGLDRIRADSCLNIWDINQRLTAPEKASSPLGSSQIAPLHGLASGDSITSLKFFQDQPKLLAAGIKNHSVRLYDLRDQSSASGYALQFATRCVNNLAIDPVDENYFASCFPSAITQIMLWDRRMVSRASMAQRGFGQATNQHSQPLEPALEMHDVIDQPGTIWALRFSKTNRGCLGALSSSGQVRIMDFGREYAVSEESAALSRPWDHLPPQALSLSRAHSATNAFFNPPAMQEMERVVSFDFTTSETKAQRPKIITLTLDGQVLVQNLGAEPRPNHILCGSKPILAGCDDRPDHQRRLEHLQKLLLEDADKQKTRCLNGYRFDASTNISLVQDELSLCKLWSWIKHAEAISSQKAMIQDDVDLSYLGIFALWMEDLDSKHRFLKSQGSGHHDVSSCVKTLARRLNLTRGRGCATEYPHNRALCLYVSGMPWSYEDLKSKSEELIAQGNVTEATAICVFAGEERLAQQVLKSKGAHQSHKMLAMALAGNRQRRRGSHGPEKADPADSYGDDWQDTISSLAEDVTDPFARAILSYVKTGSWEDALEIQDLPLQYRVNIALRHFDDLKLTRFISLLKAKVVAAGDLGGIILTGLGTVDGMTLLVNYARATDDFQTMTLAMAYAGLSERFLTHEEKQNRVLIALRNNYRQQMRSWGLKFEKAKFDIELAKVIRDNSGKLSSTVPREQIKLVCTHCSQPLSQFGHDQRTSDTKLNMNGKKGNRSTPERAAQVGVICPKCGRHLPRCGVCDLWLGVPDESYSKWYKPPRRSGVSVDFSASMAGSTITAIGPGSGTPSIKIVNTQKGSTEAQSVRTTSVPAEAVEEIDGDVANQDKERRWFEAMHRFTIFCLKCMHGFHAEHAKQWFEGSVDRDGHRFCPVPTCDCLCTG